MFDVVRVHGAPLLPVCGSVFQRMANGPMSRREDGQDFDFASLSQILPRV